MFIRVGKNECYCYPSEVWIGESGKIYSTHEYDNVVHSYDSVVGLIEWALRMQTFDYVTIQKELDLTEEQWLPPVYLSDKYRFNGLPDKKIQFVGVLRMFRCKRIELSTDIPLKTKSAYRDPQQRGGQGFEPPRLHHYL